LYIGLHVKIPLFLSCGKETWNFLYRFSKNIQISNFTKIRPVGAEIFHADGRTDGQTQTWRRYQQLFVILGKPSKSPGRIAGAGAGPIFEPGTYWIRNTSANRLAETLGSRFINGPPSTIINYANTTVAQNVYYFVTRSCCRRWLPDFPSKIPPSNILITRTLVQVTWRENVPSKCWKASNDSTLKESNKMQQHAGIYLLLNYSRCFGRPSHPSSGVHKTELAASCTDHTVWEASLFKREFVKFEGFPDSMICTRGCNYSFMYSWLWVRWTPETCRVI